MTRRWTRFTAWALACIAIPLGAATPLAAQTSVALPRYEVNDAFIFTDGRVERVRAVRGGTIVWSGLNNRRYRRSRNFIVPVLQWRVGRGSGERNIIGNPDNLWPLGNRKRARFRAVAMTKANAQARARRAITFWTCGSQAARQSTVPVGTYSVIPVRCERYSATTMRLLERIEWEYSPELGHYIRRTDIDYLGGTKRDIRLYAALRGPAGERRRLAALSRAARRSVS